MSYESTQTAAAWPLSDTIQRRNTLADWMFYDVGALTQAEFAGLSEQTNLEGSILVVEPGGGGNSIRIQKFETFETFRSEPGDLLRHFTVAGVGSSDVGAAALARSVADHLDAPVGAIVAGYGMSDMLSEALGGWFFFGSANKVFGFMDRLQDGFLAPFGVSSDAVSPVKLSNLEGLRSPDTLTLIRLLSEEERQLETLLGHSKGCLSIAYAFQAIASQPDPGQFERVRDIDVVTTGAVVAFPDNLRRLRQYLGALDWFGGMNSSFEIPHTRVPNAWHHLNTALPVHMDLASVLAGAYD